MITISFIAISNEKSTSARQKSGAYISIVKNEVSWLFAVMGRKSEFTQQPLKSIKQKSPNGAKYYSSGQRPELKKAK